MWVGKLDNGLMVIFDPSFQKEGSDTVYLYMVSSGSFQPFLEEKVRSRVKEVTNPDVVRYILLD